MKRLDWYILTELIGPFLFGVAAFSSIMIGSSLVSELANYMIEWDMPIDLIGKIFMLKLPGVIVLTFPMSTLLATLLAFGRMSGSSEIIAFKAGGVSFYRMVIPVLIVGILVSGLTIYINERVVPFTVFETRRLVTEFRYQDTLPTTQDYLKVTQIDKKKKSLDYELWADRFNGDTMTLSQVYFYDYEEKRLTFSVQAKEAKWLNDQWVFFDGKAYSYPKDDKPVMIAEFEEYDMKRIDRTPNQISKNAKRIDEMTAEELADLIRIYEKDGKNVDKLVVKYHQRFSIPFSCLIFALVGAPLGLQPNRSGSSIGLGISIVVIFIYYVVLTTGGALGQAGVILPVLGAWTPNLIFGILGISLNYKACR
ncbi:MAG: LptF/LptG family permease [Halanaerobiales bacterium]|nr:LptF/LptG family permease [Halanaerobiales bacterium]